MLNLAKWRHNGRMNMNKIKIDLMQSTAEIVGGRLVIKTKCTALECDLLRRKLAIG